MWKLEWLLRWWMEGLITAKPLRASSAPKTNVAIWLRELGSGHRLCWLPLTRALPDCGASLARAHRHNSQSAAPHLHSEPLTGTSGETEQHPDGTDCPECQPFHLIWNVLTAPWWLVIKQHIRSSTADSGGRSIGWRWGHWPPWLPLLLCWPARFGCF